MDFESARIRQYYFVPIEISLLYPSLSSLLPSFIGSNNDAPDSRDIVIASSKRALSPSRRTHRRIRIVCAAAASPPLQ